jgi:catechol 2,3-dioxygenase-like lactoylglutathione lyase family enzyme
VSQLRSGPLAAWAAAFFAGRVSIDQAADAVAGTDAPHQVGGLPAYDVELVPLREVLVLWRRAGGGVRCVLPVAGDVRGLPGPAPFRSAALERGEAVVGGGLGVVPTVIDYAPSSAPSTVLWQAFATEPAPRDDLSINDAQYELTTAIRESASALSAADVAGWVDDIADTLHDARHAGERLNLPPTFPARAVALLAQAERLQAVLDLAFADPSGGAVDRTGIAARADALRPLATAVRRARMAGYNAEAM